MTVGSKAPAHTARMWGISSVGLLFSSFVILRACLASERFYEHRCALSVLCGGCAAMACSVAALRRWSFWWGLVLIPAAYLTVYVAFYRLIGDLQMTLESD